MSPATNPKKTLCSLSSATAMAVATLAAAPLGAQTSSGREVVQPLPTAATAELKQALAQLARNPRSVDALIAAGTASLELDDVDAAMGFFGRASELAPSDPRLKAGRAAALVRLQEPVEALALFREAEAAGVPIVKLAGDYGLALDLVGNNAEAQARYRMALGSAASDEVSRRMALSQAISGDAAAFEDTLRPLLARRDFAAYRTRAFGLAILGKADDAVAITDAVMPKAMATKLEPYLRFMPQLTRAQQAAAANLGVYPTAARIGRDDPRIAALSGAAPPQRVATTTGGGLAPAGAPLGSRVAPAADAKVAAAAATDQQADAAQGVIVASRDEAERAVRVARRDAASDPLSRSRERPRIVSPAPASPEPSTPAATRQADSPRAVSSQPAGGQPAISAVRVAAAPSLRLPEQAQGSGELAPASVSSIAPAETAPVAVAVAAPSVTPGASPGFDLGRMTGAVETTTVAPSIAAPSVTTASAAASTPSAAAPPVPTPEPASVADAFADLSLTLPGAARPAVGAVDITAIKAPREVEKKEEAVAAKTPPSKPQPTKPSHPSRFWVQVATGQDRAALKFDWRRFGRQAGALLEGKGPFVTPWGQTNRLLAGPYANRDDARKALNSLKEKGIDGFTFTSPDGQEVEPLK